MRNLAVSQAQLVGVVLGNFAIFHLPVPLCTVLSVILLWPLTTQLLQRLLQLRRHRKRAHMSNDGPSPILDETGDTIGYRNKPVFNEKDELVGWRPIDAEAQSQ